MVYRCLLELYRDRLHAQLLELLVDILDPPFGLGLVDDASVHQTSDILPVILSVMVALKLVGLRTLDDIRRFDLSRDSHFSFRHYVYLMLQVVNLGGRRHSRLDGRGVVHLLQSLLELVLKLLDIALYLIVGLLNADLYLQVFRFLLKLLVLLLQTLGHACVIRGVYLFAQCAHLLVIPVERATECFFVCRGRAFTPGSAGMPCMCAGVRRSVILFAARILCQTLARLAALLLRIVLKRLCRAPVLGSILPGFVGTGTRYLDLSVSDALGVFVGSHCVFRASDAEPRVCVCSVCLFERTLTGLAFLVLCRNISTESLLVFLLSNLGSGCRLSAGVQSLPYLVRALDKEILRLADRTYPDT